MKTIKNYKKTTLTFLLAFLSSISGFAFGCFPDETFSKSAKIAQSGKIKFREDYVYPLNQGNVVSSGIKIGYERFDKLGQKLEEVSFSRDGKALLEVTYTYDEWGREAQCLGLKGNKSFFSKWEYQFNDSNKTLEKAVYNSSTNQEKTIYYFDSVGNIVEEINYSKEGDLIYHYLIVYTEFNKPLEITELSGNGVVYEKWKYFYDKNNQNIEIHQYNGSDELFKKYLNTYDVNGLQKEALSLDRNGNPIEKIVSVYQYF
jgi:uncharacterized protein YkuJ